MAYINLSHHTRKTVYTEGEIWRRDGREEELLGISLSLFVGGTIRLSDIIDHAAKNVLAGYERSCHFSQRSRSTSCRTRCFAIECSRFQSPDDLFVYYSWVKLRGCTRPLISRTRQGGANLPSQFAFAACSIDVDWNAGRERVRDLQGVERKRYASLVKFRNHFYHRSDVIVHLSNVY